MCVERSPRFLPFSESEPVHIDKNTDLVLLEEARGRDKLKQWHKEHAVKAKKDPLVFRAVTEYLARTSHGVVYERADVNKNPADWRVTYRRSK